MTEQEAKRVLESPKFGDPECIRAVKVIEEEAECVKLRAQLEGKKTECWCCEGDGEVKCKAGCVHVCPTCDGEEELTLSKQILGGMVLYQLLDLAKEARASR